MIDGDDIHKPIHYKSVLTLRMR